MSQFKPANSRARQLTQSILARALQLIPVASEPLRQVGDLSGYARWKRERFQRTRLFSHRERLWEAIRPTLGTGLTVMEFGVAWGYATNWWLQRLPDRNLTWHGFDTFTGLPTTWDREGLIVAPLGAFSAHGDTPRIDDSRVEWHVGDVKQTLAARDWSGLGGRPLFVMFDFDLYEPTAVAMQALLPYFKAGDVLYFDEAFDAWNERRAIDELLLGRFHVTCLGSTATALALRLERAVPKA